MIWAFIAMAAAITFLTGNFTEMSAVVFGFISFGTIFMGMIGVLPTMVAHPAPAKKQMQKVPVEKEAVGYARAGQVSIH